MTAQDPSMTAPATRQDITLLKLDITLLKQDLSVFKQDTAILIQNVTEPMQKDINLLKQDVGILKKDVGMLTQTVGTLMEQMTESEERIKRYFDVTVENLMYDFTGAKKDRIENHEDRIRRLERHNGLIAA